MASAIPKTMKALVKTKEGTSYDYTNMPIPEPEDDEVLIKVDAVSICGSDLNMYTWNDVARIISKIPFVPGHECAGTVVKCGPKADIPVGAKVGVENHLFCGECYQCKNDCREICNNLGQFGHGRKTKHGGCSEYTLISAKYLYQLTRNLTADQIAMLEPLGVAHNAVERLDSKGEDVLIIGCGPIGLLVGMVAKALGAKRLIGSDINSRRLELAEKIGFDITVNTQEEDIKKVVMEFTDGEGIGRVCECSGAPVMVNGTFSYLRNGGIVVLVGIPKQPLHVENVLKDVVFVTKVLKAITIKSVYGRRIFHTWKETEALVADGKVDVNAVISHRFPLSKFEDAFQVLFGGHGCKVVLYP